MRCCMCKRPLGRVAVPGLLIGPKCARDRGLMPEPARRTKVFAPRRPSKGQEQIDWIKQLNAGAAGERTTA